MEKRTLIAVAISFLVLSFYPLLLKQFYPQYGKAPVAATRNAEQSSIVTPQIVQPGQPQALPETEDLRFENGKLVLIFNAIGGGIREVAFPAYPDSETKKPLQFFSLKDSLALPTVLSFGDKSDDNIRYAASLDRSTVELSSMLMQGRVRVVKTYEFSGYSCKLNLRFENTTDIAQDLSYEISAGSRIPARHSIDSQYLEANFFMAPEGKKTLKHLNENRPGKEVRSEHPIRWAAIKDRHFSTILRPETPDVFHGVVRGLGDHHFSVSLVSPKTVIPASGSVSQDFLLYIGPNELEELMPLGLDDLVNFGKLDAIGKLLVGGLELLHKVFRNYGVAILVLTILINVLLFPLTRASYMSMKRMQLIQPQMTKLREQMKKNPEKLNREMMELYKKHKVNPFGGCLPMLLQMPVFIALYVALSKSVILVNSRFLWVKDLSTPDRLPLPFSLPFLGNEIHVLPLIMCAAMFVQQKFTAMKMEGQDPAMATQQKMMTVMMPILFGFIFYSMPSGLVLYWLTNTILMSLYQFHLKKVTLT